MTRTLVSIALISFALGGCVPPAEEALPPATVEELLEADRAFARETVERGLDGWMSWYTDDAARFRPGGEIARGLEAIREHDAPGFADPALQLAWEPTGGGVFDDGDHGFTVGRWEMTRSSDGAAPETISRGTYVSIWRREDSGAWKVILDTGTIDPPDPGDGPE
jgi:ketosteroid isomerase-like protein